MADEIISRVEAIARGLKRYRTGKPCKCGHVGFRNVINCACVECATLVTDQWIEGGGRKIKNRQSREWHERNPSYSGQWAKDNPESIRQAKRKWYLKRPEKRIEVALDWAKRNPERRRTHVRNREARRQQAEGSHTPEEILVMLERQGWKCAACDVSIREKRHIDHIIPLSKDGSNYIANLQGLCPSCNCSKHDKDPFIWAQENGRLL